jgi:hypothetical protein
MRRKIGNASQRGGSRIALDENRSQRRKSIDLESFVLDVQERAQQSCGMTIKL